MITWTKKREIKVFDNFLSDQDFKNLCDLILSDHFPWYWINQSTWKSTKHKKDSFFCHSIKYKDEINSSFMDQIMKPFKEKLKYKELLRAKINLSFNQGKPIRSNYHTDFPELDVVGKKYQTAIYYLNTCDGPTQFKVRKIKIKSVANRLVWFPGELEHRVVTQTDANRRVGINFNFKI